MLGFPVRVTAQVWMAPELAVIILNYRTPELVRDCLEALEGEIEPGIAALVVDNDSGDGSAEAIERLVSERGWSRWARVLRAPRNGGFASGNNAGIRAVHARAYVLLNSDTLVRPGALRSLGEGMKAHPRAGVIGAGMLDAAGRRDACAFRFLSPATELLRAANTGPLSRLLERAHPLMPETEVPLEVDWVGFACALIRRELIEAIGLLDEGYFMYFEDVDYCRRAREAGWSVVHWPGAKVVHLQGASSGITAAPSTIRRRAPRYYYEARARYFAKFYGRGGLWLANALWCCGRGISAAREALGRAPVHREREALDIWIGARRPLGRRFPG
jgi:GT2 family glycosyltransferase